MASYIQTKTVLLSATADGWWADYGFRSSGFDSVFLSWELELVPVYLMISIWGGKKRQYASTKFILYTAGSSLFILLAGLAMGFWTGTPNFEYTYLMEQGFPPNFQLWCYGAFLIAFGVKLPIVPFHTWLPDAHGEATAPVHMLLAGILLKMGGYALLRFNCQLLPEAHKVFAPALIIMGAVNIIYAALTSFAQRNLKRKYCLQFNQSYGICADWCW